MASYVLCDPALLMPPPHDPVRAATFWTRLIAWAEDRRLRLGPAGYEAVLASLERVGGWPTLDHAKYPPGLSNLAHRALSQMLQQVTLHEDTDVPLERPYEFDPAYVAHPPAGESIAADIAVLHEGGLIGLATDVAHWQRPTDEVTLDPPPPKRVGLVLEAHQRLVRETDESIATYFAKRRLIIVGGVPNEHLPAQLAERFSIADVRWAGSEPEGGVNLDLLKGLRAEVDVVYCITGHIGHDDSIRAKRRCGKRGVVLRKVARPNQVIDDLRERHGERD